MSNWIKEFGASYDVPSEIINHPQFIDESWHNDMSPSFHVRGTDYVAIFCEHPEPDKRALGECKRYIVGVIDPKHQISDEPDFDTDDINEAIAKALEIAPKYPAYPAEKQPPANPRFVWLVGSIQEVYPDLPNGSDYADGLILWDRQEKKPVMTLHPEYAQAMCLEHNTPEGGPFTNCENWFNSLDNTSMESEGLPATRPEVMQSLPFNKENA